jgi:hypothetical protein
VAWWWGRPTPPGSCWSTSVLCLLVSSGAYFVAVKFRSFLTIQSSFFILSGISLLKIIIHQNSWKLSVIIPKFLLVTISIHNLEGL